VRQDAGVATTHPRFLYAHRGAAAELPENTLPAFARAVELGVGAIETDAHLSRDGHVVLAHDASAQRMGGRDLRWRDHDLAEIQAVDVGWGFQASDGSRPFAGQGFRVPTFAEALAAFPDARFNVDLKQATPPMVGPMLAPHPAAPRRGAGHAGELPAAHDARGAAARLRRGHRAVAT
jgi:glycerophosphoryl diester phosphodiesterase